jgi:hypothetical protein
MNQIWETPELVVLVQGRNEERVLLQGCKGNTADAESFNNSCFCEQCLSCYAQGLT